MIAKALRKMSEFPLTVKYGYLSRTDGDRSSGVKPSDPLKMPSPRLASVIGQRPAMAPLFANPWTLRLHLVQWMKQQLSSISILFSTHSTACAKMLFHLDLGQLFGEMRERGYLWPAHGWRQNCLVQQRRLCGATPMLVSATVASPGRMASHNQQSRPDRCGRALAPGQRPEITPRIDNAAEVNDAGTLAAAMIRLAISPRLS